MQEKLTILISSESKQFIKKHARKQNKSISRFIDDLLASVKREATLNVVEDEWVKKTAGTYNSGKKDLMADLFKDIKK
ncbi:MAG: DUF6364 family protein [Flavisolibacter sp.]